MPEEASNTQGTSLKWNLLAALGVLSVYLYVFMEWLFFATKPSFMSALDIPGSLLDSLQWLLYLSALIWFRQLYLSAGRASLLIGDPNYQTAWMGIARLVPVFILSSALLCSSRTTLPIRYSGSGSGPQEERGACFARSSVSLLLCFCLSLCLKMSRRMPGMSEG